MLRGQKGQENTRTFLSLRSEAFQTEARLSRWHVEGVIGHERRGGAGDGGGVESSHVLLGDRLEPRGPCPCCGTLGKLLNSCVPRFPLRNDIAETPPFTRLFYGLNGVSRGKYVSELVMHGAAASSSRECFASGTDGKSVKGRGQKKSSLLSCLEFSRCGWSP